MDKRIANLSAGRLTNVEEASELIRQGLYLGIAGDEALLRRLPKGNWIAGTIPYFMGQHGGQTSSASLFVSELPVWAGAAQIRFYDTSNIHRVCADAPTNGYSLIIIPLLSEMHIMYAQDAPGFEDMFVKPIMGWISGVHLDDLDRVKPCVVNGQTLEFSSEKAIVIHVPLPDDYYANIDIINLFVADQGDTIRFPAGTRGFTVNACTVNGKPHKLGEYMTQRKVDPRLPLVANYNGSMVNAGVRSVDEQTGEVVLYAPVFENVPYQIPLLVEEYPQAFIGMLPKDVRPFFTCNCLSNYLYSELEGKKVPIMLGPMTYGEIAYQLVNQTLVYMTLEHRTA